MVVILPRPKAVVLKKVLLKTTGHSTRPLGATQLSVVSLMKSLQMPPSPNTFGMFCKMNDGSKADKSSRLP